MSFFFPPPLDLVDCTICGSRFVIKREHFVAQITFRHLVDVLIQNSLRRVQQEIKLKFLDHQKYRQLLARMIVK